MALVRKAAGPDADLLRYHGTERFDVPQYWSQPTEQSGIWGSTAGASWPNIVICGVDGLEERR